MKNRRQLILSFFFAAILALPFVAISVLQLGQAYIKSTRQERLEKEQQVRIVLAAKDVVWEEEGREVWVGDKLYDISSYTIKDGKFYFTGVYDEDETEIAETLLHTVFSASGNDLLYLLFLLQSFSILLALIELLPNQLLLKTKKSFYFALLLSPPLLVIAPPPRW